MKHYPDKNAAFPNLHVVMLMGNVAKKAAKYFRLAAKKGNRDAESALKA